jgi:PAS domain S-box-containing protein
MANAAAIHETDEHGRLRNRRPRQVSSPKLSTLTWLGLGTIAIALIAWTGGLVWSLERQFVSLQHAHVIVTGLQNILSDLQDAESQEHGYLLSGRQSYLETYNRSRKALNEEFGRLQAIAVHDPAEREEVLRLRYLVYEKLDDLQKTMDMRATAGFDATRAKVPTLRGEQLRDAVRQNIGRMEEGEQNSMARFSQEWHAGLKTGLAALAGSAILAMCGLLIGQTVLARTASQRQRAEEELETSHSRFETLCEQAPLGIYETDAEGFCVYTNRRWSTMSGLSAAESLGHGWKKVLHPEDRETVFEGWETTAREGTTWEYRLLTGQGETRWIRAVGGPVLSARGEVTGYVGTLEDVTERKLAEERFRLVVEATPSGMVIVDQLGKIVLVNTRTEELFGYERKDLLGQQVEILVPELSRDGHDALRRDFFTHAQVRQMGAGRELHGVRKDGSWFSVQIGLNPIDTGSGMWVLASVLDTTERRRTERALRESRQDLRALAGRLFRVQEEERKRIARELHDDLSQSVALLAFDTSNLALSPPREAEDLKKALCKLQSRIADLSADIRQIAHQLHPSILEDLGLGAALRELCEEFSARETTPIVFEQQAPQDVLPMEIASCLYRVAQEALHNIQKHARASHIWLTISGDAERVHLCIRDDGVGFASESGASSQGLGIISMKERVRLVQGEFSIHSQPGQGTRLSASVPLPGGRDRAHAVTFNG